MRPATGAWRLLAANISLSSMPTTAGQPAVSRGSSLRLAGLSGPAMAFGHLRHFLCPSLDQESRNRFHCPVGTAPGYFAGAMLIRLDDFRSIGPFEEDLRVGEFAGWLARARDRGLAQAMVGDVVLERRIHLANHTLTWRNSAGGYTQMLKRMIDRRRSETK